MTNFKRDTSFFQAYMKPAFCGIATGSAMFMSAGLIYQVYSPSNKDLIEKALISKQVGRYGSKALYEQKYSIENMKAVEYIHETGLLANTAQQQLYYAIAENTAIGLICSVSGTYILYGTSQCKKVFDWVNNHVGIKTSQDIVVTMLGGLIGSTFMSGAISNKLSLSHFCDFFTSSLWGFALGAATTYSTIKSLDECDISAIQMYHGTYHHDETMH